MSKISIDAALTLLPTTSKPLAPDESRGPAFVEHLDRARAERMSAPNCPPPPASPTARDAVEHNTTGPTQTGGSSGDGTTRNETAETIDETPPEERPTHDDDPTETDTVELSGAAVAAANPTPQNVAAAGANKAAVTVEGESAIEIVGQSVGDQPESSATSADPSTVKASQSASQVPTAEAQSPTGVADDVTANADRELDPNAIATRHIEPKTEVHASASTAAAKPSPLAAAKNVEHAAAKEAKDNGPTVTKASSEAATTTAASAKPTATRPTMERTSGAKREPTSQQNPSVSEAATSTTQILVSAEPTHVGTTVVTADRKIDAVDWTTSVTHNSASVSTDNAAPTDAPRETTEPAPRTGAAPTGDGRPTHAGRLDGIPIAGRPATANSHEQISQADRVRLVQRVSRALQSAADRGGEVRLRLSPPELGSLRMEVVVQHGQMSAHIETETAAAKTALLDNLPALRSRLAEQDITVARFDVDVMDNPTAGNHQQYDQDGDWNRQGSAPRANSATRPSSEANETAKSVRTIAGSSGELNIVV